VIEIYDIDGTLTTSGDTPRQPLIDYIKTDVQDEGVRIFIVSGRAISRLEETKAWLEENGVPYERIFLNDFSETPGPDVVQAFKAYKYSKIVDEYGLAEIGYLVDDDAEARNAAEGMGIKAYSPQELLDLEESEMAEDRAPVAGKDKFTTQAEAMQRAEEIGCEGTHTMDENGQKIYMPCRTHAAYDAIVNTDTSAPGYRAPAPPSEQIKGSDENAPGSAAGQTGDIELSEATQKALETKASDHNEAMAEADRPNWTRVRVPALQAVYRRGSGAYSTSFRPGIGRAQWSMARVNAFLFLARTGAPENPAYVGDNDLLHSDHPRYAEKDRSLENRAVYEVPEYIREAARKGLEWHEQGLSGDGLQPQTVAEARELAAGRADSDKVMRMAAWIRRHRTDWEGVPQNSDRTNEDFPGPGAVSGFLWGVETTDPEGADRVISWADRLIESEDREIVDMKEKEVRSLPIGEFRLGEAGEDGQRTFTGYAAIWNSASEGLPFEERIAPNAFKRSLARATAGQKIIAFLFGHDETRALATTASGRLQLNEDETGLRVEAKLDPSDPDAAKVISMLTHESAAAGMSFGFQKIQDTWDGNNRTIKEANLFEVSILAAGGQTPAYPATLGLTAIRQVTAPKIGVEAEALVATLEAVKAGRELSTEELAVIDAVRSKLAPKQVKVIDPSVAAALLTLESAEGDAL
jgi:HK97 family phage prohead protease